MAVSGRLAGPKTWDLIVGIFGTRFGQSQDLLQTVIGPCVIIYAINCVVWVLLGRKWPWISVPQSGSDAW